MKRAILALALVGCSMPIVESLPLRLDAQIEGDAAVVVETDAGADAFVALDVYTAPEQDASLDACALVGPSGCADGFTCRRALEDAPIAETGPASCVAAGSISEGDAAHPCSPFDDQCSGGLFCDTPHVCARYCAGFGAACPDLHGSPQRCTANDVGVFRCAT